jgi:hypothetical protein
MRLRQNQKGDKSIVMLRQRLHDKFDQRFVIFSKSRDENSCGGSGISIEGRVRGGR